ncbi:bifunctional alpha,alpha-trehalose-phosphate synthase (UDP-forming)/trehalose-phosphatase [Microbacteriaceae bacterium]|nr:bifunctional alpha,alpha-trehalose-phosphate synthase (UDP-forming)/trehalose-phosphatase [Candidatus Saccharibacteria bacterium]
MHNFVIVSNRLPVSVSRVDGKLTFNVSSGGLATAMSSLDMDTTNQTWVGWPGIASDDLTSAEKATITKELKKYKCHPVHLTSQQIADFYEGYSNDTLWPLFHYFQSYSQYNDAYWQAYKAVNRKFLQALRRQADPKATIWIQDYQLMLLPQLTREALPQTKIGFFLHIPFPSYEIFRFLPQRKEILEGLMGADLLGFHIYDYARHFLSSSMHLLGTTSSQGFLEYNGRRVKVDAFPIGIDYKKFRQTLFDPETKEEITRLNERYQSQKILLSVDRLDYSKGIMKRLEAYELLLITYPQLQKRVAMIVIAVPSRTEVDAYKNLRDEIEQAVSRINGMFGTTDWAPISYQFQNLQFEHIVALYAKADIALVTPLRDGMNLVAKEFIASKKNGHGVLVLSEMAGAANELSEAIQVNPNDTTALMRGIYEALTMKKNEQAIRLKAMQQRISDYTVQEWGSDFISQLETAHTSHLGALHKKLSNDDIATIVDEYKKATHRLILLDYDGTLKLFSNSISASASKPSAALRAQLARIAKQDNTTLCIISGRPRSTLNAWFKNIPNIKLIAEHGAWVKENNVWHNTAADFDKKEIIALFKHYATRTAGAVVEEKDFSVVWHFRRVSPELAYIRNDEIKRDLRRLNLSEDIGIFAGNKIIEIKPKSINKGEAAIDLLYKYPSDFIFSAGDDFTDEDMFISLPPYARTVKVGFGDTSARHQAGKLDRILKIIDEFGRKN